MNWEKLGCLYDPSSRETPGKLVTHAANPLPVHIDDDIYRVFYSGRDTRNRSSVGAVDIDIVQRKVVREHQRAFFEHGEPGSYYADGVSIGNCYSAGAVTYMLFMGWQNPPDTHWRGDIGRLLLTDELELELADPQPLMGVNDVDPVSLSYPWVMPDRAGGFHMWYGSTVTWDAGNGEMLHVINHAASDDGQRWRRTGQSVPHVIGEAQAFSHPTVLSGESGYSMWYSYRGGNGGKYRIGHARSVDGIQWELMNDKAGIDVSGTGWDSEMIEYPCVFEHKGELYMLYNGNGYGRTGFGLAVCPV